MKLPEAIQLEESLLSVALFGLDGYEDVLALDPELFSSTQNRIVFEGIRKNHEKDLPLSNGADADIIQKLSSNFVQNIPAAIHELKIKSIARNAIYNLQDAIGKLHIESDPEPIINQLIGKLSDDSSAHDGISKIGDSLLEVFKKINEVRDGTSRLGVSTGLDFDKHLGGFEDGKLYIIAARPAMGKSAFALEIIKRVASTGIPVGMMSLEMGHTSLSLRLLTSAVSIDAGLIRQGKLTEDEMLLVQKSCEELSNLPIYFDDNSYVTATSLRAKANYMRRKYGIGMLVVDYLQLMTGDNDSRERDIAEVSRMCKIIAKELEIPVIALAQLNRGVEVRDSKRPRLSDLRESGAIEQDADAVMFLYRPEYYGIEYYDERDPAEYKGASTKNICEVIIGKNRDGETGSARQVFVPELMKFGNLERHWSDLEF